MVILMQDFYQAGFKLILMSSFYLCMKDIIMEVTQREKQEEIIPDPDVDAYMKVPYSIHKTSSSCIHSFSPRFNNFSKAKILSRNNLLDIDVVEQVCFFHM